MELTQKWLQNLKTQDYNYLEAYVTVSEAYAGMYQTETNISDAFEFKGEYEFNADYANSRTGIDEDEPGPNPKKKIFNGRYSDVFECKLDLVAFIEKLEEFLDGSDKEGEDYEFLEFLEFSDDYYDCADAFYENCDLVEECISNKVQDDAGNAIDFDDYHQFEEMVFNIHFKFKNGDKWV